MMDKKIPRCTNQPMFLEWIESARQSNMTLNRSDELLPYCVDCTPEYQQEMIEQDRCDYPQVRFRLDRDGLIEGYLPGKKNARQPGETDGQKIELAMEEKG